MTQRAALCDAAQESLGLSADQGTSTAEVKRPEWALRPLDQYILARLERKGLTPSPPADRYTLIRRLKFDLLGLPPTAEEVQSFVNDPAPDAYAQLVERYLASPHYGERWGRHWLDVARYADTRGYAFNRERRYPYAYTYRDYVIEAFNKDLPYDQFLDRTAGGRFARPSFQRSPSGGVGIADGGPQVQQSASGHR